MGIDDRETLEWLDTATLAKQPYLVADPDRVPVRHADFPLQHSGDLLDDIDHCRRIVEARGMEVLVLDQTRADIGMPVAKVVVPGLRHLHARFGPGRLYDVPVAMGWLGAPRDESGLNPVWMFL
jgi:ribosomal protein S12 methylthiotransferase accessory factor